jgi:hypothetical protein
MREFAKRTDSGISTIAVAIDGSRPGPKSRTILAAWADALDLRGNDRARFFLLADLSRSPPNVQEVVDVDRVMEESPDYDPTEPAAGNYFGEHLEFLLQSHAETLPVEDDSFGISDERLRGLMRGHVKPTTADVDVIINALDLDEISVAELKQLAAIAHAPVEARADLVQVLDLLVEQSRKAARVEEALGDQ